MAPDRPARLSVRANQTFDMSLPEPSDKILEGNASAAAMINYMIRVLQIILVYRKQCLIRKTMN